jgi:hypothetical protein
MEAFISLLLYFLIRVANVFEYTNTISILWGGERQLNSWHYLFFDAQSQSYGILIYGRNCGIFPEAPMHALVLVLSLMIQMFKIEKVNRLKLIITVITILSTFSTTGMIVGVVSVLCKYFVDMKRKNRNLGIRQIIFIILLTVGLVMTLKIFEQKLTFAASSVNIRNRNFLYAVKAFLHSPLYGHGFKTNEYAHTSVISQVIADGGVLFFVWYFSSFIRLIYLNWKNKNYADLSFLGCWLLLMSATVITYTNLSICMIATFSCEYRNFKKTIYLDDAHIKS